MTTMTEEKKKKCLNRHARNIHEKTEEVIDEIKKVKMLLAMNYEFAPRPVRDTILYSANDLRVIADHIEEGGQLAVLRGNIHFIQRKDTEKLPGVRMLTVGLGVDEDQSQKPEDLAAYWEEGRRNR